MIAAVKAKDLRPGDVLYDADSFEIAMTRTAQWNSARIQTQALMLLMKRYWGTSLNTHDHKLLRAESRRVEHVSYGPFKARIVLGRGVVVRVPRNRVVAVVRAEENER